ncbi:serine hydrolase domain-containing protein [Phenylobacterium sp.]|uniref:serine hydrolase domain-containing protein n=1 Tax=Phenylobacterium sp. TaxID=1871053 RepID=UPI00301CBAAB
MTRRHHLAAALFAVALTCPAPAAWSQPQPAAAKAASPAWAPVQSALHPFVDQGQLPGMITLAFKDGRMVHAEAYGVRDLATGAPMEMDTIVRAFSMTKPVTAVAMMILRDEGRWKPEDPIAKHLPELAGLKLWKGKDAEGRPILEAPATPPTVGQLMTHTAGFLYGFEASDVDAIYRSDKGPMRAASTEDFLRRVADLPLAYEPGTKWKYSIAMDIQGAMVERLSGQSLAQFMDARIFRPLKMTDTGFHVPAEKRGRFAALYEWRDGRLQAPAAGSPFLSDYATPPPFASGGGGLVTTAHDYARFARMLLGGGTLDGRRIISRRAAAEMMSNHLSPELVGGKYGIGMQQIRPGYEFGYNGVVVTDPAKAGVAMGKGSYLWDGAAGTWFWVDPENRLVFVGLVQRLMGPGFPPLQPTSQKAVRAALDGTR